MKVGELNTKQKDFLKSLFEVEELPEDMELEVFLSSKGCRLYRCLSCGRLIFHDNYEFWNLSDCCDDNSRLVESGLLCEVCYSRTPENMKDWILFRPTYCREVVFLPTEGKNRHTNGE